jgi:hypothetical protein
MLAQLVVSGGLLAILITMAGESAGLPISSEVGLTLRQNYSVADLSEPSNLAA